MYMDSSSNQISYSFKVDPRGGKVITRQINICRRRKNGLQK